MIRFVVSKRRGVGPRGVYVFFLSLRSVRGYGAQRVYLWSASTQEISLYCFVPKIAALDNSWRGHTERCGNSSIES